MLYYDRIDIAKSNNSKKCMIWHYWFFNHGFNVQDYVCHGCHDLTFMLTGNAINLLKKICSQISWVSIKKYCLNF